MVRPFFLHMNDPIHEPTFERQVGERGRWRLDHDSIFFSGSTMSMGRESKRGTSKPATGRETAFCFIF